MTALDKLKMMQEQIAKRPQIDSDSYSIILLIELASDLSEKLDALSDKLDQLSYNGDQK